MEASIFFFFKKTPNRLYLTLARKDTNPSLILGGAPHVLVEVTNPTSGYLTPSHRIRGALSCPPPALGQLSQFALSDGLYHPQGEDQLPGT